MGEFDRRTMMTLLAAGGLLPRTALAAEAHGVRVPIAIEDNRIQLPVRIGGQGPFTFMIDTGTFVSLIRPELASRLRLPLQGYDRMSGVAGQTKQFAVYAARDVVIGDSFRLAELVLEDSFEFGEKQGVYGALAAGMLTAFDTELDFDAKELRLYPDGPADRSGYSRVDSAIPSRTRGSRKIMVDATLDGRTIRCELDTGSPLPLILGEHAAKRSGLWDGRPYAPLRQRGIGGAGAIDRVVRADTLALGGISAERPLVTLLGNEIGDGVDGIVGLAFIRRLNLSIDTRAGRLWVKPNHQPSEMAEHYGLAGLWLLRDGATITVAAVGSGSPAAREGIQIGDRIEGDWAGTLRAINGPAGSVAKLVVAHGGKTRDVALTLTPYL